MCPFLHNELIHSANIQDSDIQILSKYLQNEKVVHEEAGGFVPRTDVEPTIHFNITTSLSSVSGYKYV